MSWPVARDGSTRPPPPRRELHAGPLTAVYESGDLRYLRLGRQEVVRRWYVAVRDANWGTVPAALLNEQFEIGADSFRIEYDAEHRCGEIDFRWHGSIVGAAEGQITFRLDGAAHSTFWRNRIGFCILHPPRECAGARCRLTTADGQTVDAGFPSEIAPRNPFRDLRGLDYELPSGAWARLRFEGDLFETEDQRNWIDASFKTFCTPLRLPFPVRVRAGEPVRQAVTLDPVGSAVKEGGGCSDNCLSLAARPAGALPEIGLATASHEQPLTAREARLLRALRPKHLRFDLWHPWRPLRRAAELARQLDCRLELAATFSDDPLAEARSLGQALDVVRPPLARVLALHDRIWSTPERVFLPAWQALQAFDASIPVLAGTTANFTELNRGRPDFAGPAGLCYSVQPQEHAFDNDSLVECCATIADTVRSARQFGGGLPICVTPITLRKRVNPYATGPAPPPAPDALPAVVDPRQMSLFGAAWTLGALKYLAESGAASATFYETTGWLGVMEQDSGCRLPKHFPSRPGNAFPLYHVLADANEFAGATVIPAESTQPLRVDGFALQGEGRTRVMLANMTGEPLECRLLGVTGAPRVLILDETSCDLATSEPLEYRSLEAAPVAAARGELTLHLKPYAYARIDA